MPSIHDVQSALEQCMKAEPPRDFSLSPDASQLATVFAEMLYGRESERSLNAFTPKQLTAFNRWATWLVRSPETYNLRYTLKGNFNMKTPMNTPLLGCIKRIVIPETSHRVSLFNTDDLGPMRGLLSLALEGMPGPWITVCEAHNKLAGFESQALAEGKLLMPATWCPSCAAQKNNLP